MHNRSKRKETAAPFVSKQKLSTARLFNSFQPVSTRQVQDRRRGQRPTFVRNATHRCTGYQRCGSEPQRSFAVKAKSCTCSLKRDDRLSPPPPLDRLTNNQFLFFPLPLFFSPTLGESSLSIVRGNERKYVRVCWKRAGTHARLYIRGTQKAAKGIEKCRKSGEVADDGKQRTVFSMHYNNKGRSHSLLDRRSRLSLSPSGRAPTPPRLSLGRNAWSTRAHTHEHGEPGSFLQWNGGRSTMNGGHLFAFSIVRLHRGPAIVRARGPCEEGKVYDPTKKKPRTPPT